MRCTLLIRLLCLGKIWAAGKLAWIINVVFVCFAPKALFYTGFRDCPHEHSRQFRRRPIVTPAQRCCWPKVVYVLYAKMDGYHKKRRYHYDTAASGFAISPLLPLSFTCVFGSRLFSELETTSALLQTL